MHYTNAHRRTIAGEGVCYTVKHEGAAVNDPREDVTDDTASVIHAKLTMPLLTRQRGTVQPLEAWQLPPGKFPKRILA